MRFVSIGGGPSGLYFGILMKKADPSHEVLVLERNRPEDTFGFGVVFSDATLENLARADAETYARITSEFAHWDDIDIHYQGEVLTSTGHGFSGLARRTLLSILVDRARALGVELAFEREVPDPEVYRDADLVLGADGVNSTVRTRYADRFEPSIDRRPNRFVWLGTSFPFPAFTFYFKMNEHGLWRVHAYRYEKARSTFIVECTHDTLRRAGLEDAGEEANVRYLEALFEKELDGHPLLANRSIWRSFPTVRNRRWHHENVVLLGDAAHTAHFSIGSGTKLAMEDSIALAEAILRKASLETALLSYEEERRPVVESTQRAAQVSLEWFEHTERSMHLDPLQFAFSLLTRSLRVTHENLRVRDPAFVARVDRWFSESARGHGPLPGAKTPPMFTPFSLRGMRLENRVVVSPMCMYSAEDGTIGDFHLVHLGSRAMGGAGLVLTEMTCVSRDARISPGCAGMYLPEHADAWRRVTRFVHEHGNAKIGLQLGHAGRKGATNRMWEGHNQPLEEGAWPIFSASPIPFFPHSQIPREMAREDMDRVKSDFVRATEMAVEAEFDMLELHFAHGYLLASFLSPLTNRRTDEHGGPIERRALYPLEVFDAVRRAWPEERPIAVRISATDWAPGGITDKEVIALARMLEAHGADILDVSTGQTVAEDQPGYGRLYQTPFSELVRAEAGVPTMSVGSISSYADVNSILAAGRADLCVLARAHLFDPYWTRHAAYEQDFPIPWPDPYEPMRRYRWRFK